MRRLGIIAAFGAAIAAVGGAIWRGRRITTRPRWHAVQRRARSMVGRSVGPQAWVGPYLREQGVPYEIQHHPTTYTAQELAASEHVPGRQVAKVVMVSSAGRPTMLVLAAIHKVDLRRAATAIGVQDVRLATEDEFAALFPDCDVGAMPPFGERYGIPVYVDTALAEAERIVCAAGSHTDTVSLRYTDFARLTQPVVADFRGDTAAAEPGTAD